MKSNLASLRELIREEMLREGMFDGSLGAGNPTSPTAAEKAAVAASSRDNAKNLSRLASKKLVPVVKKQSDDLKDRPKEEIKSILQNWGKKPEEVPGKEQEPKPAANQAQAGQKQAAAKPAATAPTTVEKPDTLDKDVSKDPARATAALLKLSNDPASSRDIASYLKTNPALRTAVNSVPGSAELDASVNSTVLARGRESNKNPSDYTKALSDFSKRNGLSESHRRLIRQEIMLFLQSRGIN